MYLVFGGLVVDVVGLACKEGVHKRPYTRSNKHPSQKKQNTQDENAVLESEKQELIAAQVEKEHKMSKLTDLVISAGANMSMEQAAAAHARKVKATTRQSWCPGALSGAGAMGAFAGFPSRAPTNKLALASGIEEGDESLADWEAPEKRKSTDSSMSLCSETDDASASEIARLQAVIAGLEHKVLNALDRDDTSAADNALGLEQQIEALRYPPYAAAMHAQQLCCVPCQLACCLLLFGVGLLLLYVG